MTVTIQRIAILLALLFATAADAAPSIQNWVLKSTNTTFYGNSVTIFGKVLTFTNAQTATTVLTNATANGSATNLYSQLGASRIGGLFALMTNANTILLRGDGLVVTQTGNWCSLTATTNTGPLLSDYIWPVESIPDATTRSNQLSDLTAALSKYPTGQVSMAAPAFINFLNAGNGSQTKTGAVTLGTVSGNIGNLSNGTIRATSISGAAYDNGSIGTTFGSEVLADNLVLDSGRLLVRGPSGQTNTLQATDSGLSLYAGRDTSTPLDMRFPDDPAALLNFWSLIRLFPNLQSGIWIGTNLWNIRNDWYGTLNVFHDQLLVTNLTGVGNSLTSSRFAGTNVISGRVQYTRAANSTLVNGNNAGILLGTNVYITLSGPTGISELAGFAAEPDGAFHIIQLRGAGSNWIVNYTGSSRATDPTAANRFECATGGDLLMTNNPASFGTIYDASVSRWQILWKSN